jgi:hypothetical protein
MNHISHIRSYKFFLLWPFMPYMVQKIIGYSTEWEIFGKNVWYSKIKDHYKKVKMNHISHIRPYKFFLLWPFMPYMVEKIDWI